MKFYRGQPINIAINGILVPGIVTDPEERDRTIITRKRPDGLVVANSVIVTSFRKPPERDAFYMDRAENSQFVSPRATRSGPIRFTNWPMKAAQKRGLVTAVEAKVLPISA